MEQVTSEPGLASRDAEDAEGERHDGTFAQGQDKDGENLGLEEGLGHERWQVIAVSKTFAQNRSKTTWLAITYTARSFPLGRGGNQVGFPQALRKRGEDDSGLRHQEHLYNRIVSEI